MKFKFLRREFIEFHFTLSGLALASMASPVILGTKDHMYLTEKEDLKQKILAANGDLEKINEFSRSKFVLDSTENPHPRFSGLMKSIRERRTEKVKILIPLYQD